MAKSEFDELNEVKATGENSSTMDPVTPAGGSPRGKNRRADLNKSVNPTADDIEDDVKHPGGEPFGNVSPAESKNTGKKAPARRADKVAVGESVEEMFEGQDLSEDFKEKAAVIFEAALNDRLTEEVERLEEEFEARLEEQTSLVVEELVESVDKYLDDVVATWMEENELAVDRGIKIEMAESLMAGLYDLFMEHNINVPEESEDVLDEMMSTIEELEGKLDEALNVNMDLVEELEEAIKRDIYADMCEGLTETQAEKLIRLAEGVDFDDEDTFAEKVSIIKENYFGKTNKMLKETFGDDIDPVETENSNVVSVDPTMNRYAAAISKTLKK